MKSQYRVRVERMLKGEFSSSDLSSLLLFMRNRTGGGETVKEIGHFVAHQDERYKGLVTETTRDWFKIARYFGSSDFRAGLDLYRISPLLISCLDATLRRLDKDFLNQNGFKIKEAKKNLATIIGNFYKRTDGYFEITSKHSSEELKLFDLIANTLAIQPAFTGDQLYSEFSEMLLKIGLVTRREQKMLEQIKPVLLIFAVSMMHKSIITLEDGGSSQLTAQITQDGIDILAAVPSDVKNISLASAIFSVKLDTKSLCEPCLLSPGSWDFGLEVNTDNRLSALR